MARTRCRAHWRASWRRAPAAACCSPRAIAPNSTWSRTTSLHSRRCGRCLASDSRRRLRAVRGNTATSRGTVTPSVTCIGCRPVWIPSSWASRKSRGRCEKRGRHRARKPVLYCTGCFRRRCTSGRACAPKRVSEWRPPPPRASRWRARSSAISPAGARSSSAPATWPSSRRPVSAIRACRSPWSRTAPRSAPARSPSGWVARRYRSTKRGHISPRRTSRSARRRRRTPW